MQVASAARCWTRSRSIATPLAMWKAFGMVRIGLSLALALATGAAASTHSGIESGDRSNRYELMVALDPRSGAMRVAGTIALVADQRAEQMPFLLNAAFDRVAISGPMVDTVEIESGITLDGYALPRTQRATVRLARPLAAGETALLHIAYSGTVRTQDIEFGRGVIAPHWTELSFDSLWYPVLMDDQELRARVRLSLPEGYAVTAPGSVTRLADGDWLLDAGDVVSRRISMLVSDAWHVAGRDVGGGRAARLYTVDPEPRAQALLGAVATAWDRYSEWFGAPAQAIDVVKLVYANRDPGLRYPNQAYATNGDFIVLDNSAPEVQRDTLHHEVAHMWWSAGQPGTPDEFLSEPLAEYSAMRVGGEVFGDGWLAARRQKIAARSDAIEASFLDLDGLSDVRQPLLYARGPTVLWRLHDSIGADAMDALLRAVRADDVRTLECFLALLAVREGAEQAAAVRGGL